VVPVYAPDGAFSICDSSGLAVLHAFAETSGPASVGDAPAPLWRLSLRTAAGDSFAAAIQVRSRGRGISPTGLEFNILDARGEYFATLVQLQLPRGQRCFQLTTQTGDRLHFWGNFQTQAVNITDDQGDLIGATEPSGAGPVVSIDQARIYYRLRVAQETNAGLPLLSLLCIGQILRSGDTICSLDNL